jgi:hypothetical protein
LKKFLGCFPTSLIAFLSVASMFFCAGPASAQTPRWSERTANAWYARQPWLVGSNYIPGNAINQLEMWQETTFDPAGIDRELGWAQAMGMNTMRVFLHDLLWQQDAAGLQKRIDQFLAIAARHHIRPIFVIFDSCWDPLPRLGPQHPPIPGVHNSGWVQSPGALALADPAQYPRLQAYVEGLLRAFAQDDRILAWDLWNEPGADNAGSYPRQELKVDDKIARVKFLLPQVFAWARNAHPTQPLTAGVWDVDPSTENGGLGDLQSIELGQSDIVTFHNYSWPEEFQAEVAWLKKKYNRPVICTEYMARSVGSTFDGILPIAKQERIGAINWGFVAGKTQTYFPWDSWQRPYVLEQPPVWFHEVLRQDGAPYRKAEVDLIRRLTSAP